MRDNIILECTECGEQTYLTSKNRRNNPDRLEIKKYCPRERRMTLHREVKK
ncbi:MAG: 50S ribosomal protein L33 [Firmicutes bacterium]|uniref:Large ribosomal subunit protein bL33 n=1 Tax=Candidatus Gallilactobacillus intestinavium TaxID=2840838 RepID=A0A9D9H8B2_9LACO|nr:50S ribosomal protein L33 [Candidatus Gallilactobacillus intestinavium]